MNDTERIDWLIKAASEGDCPALISDDNGHWAVSSTGVQSVPAGDDEPQFISTTFLVEEGEWFDDPRAAIDEYIREAESVTTGGEG